MRRRRFGLVLLVGGIVFTAALAIGAPALAGDSKVPLCHATGSGNYNSLSVPPDQVLNPNGHGSHPEDIIPPFDYNGQPFNGLNWTTEGQVIWNKGGCNGDGSQAPPTSSSDQSTSSDSTSSDAQSTSSDSTSSSDQSTSSDSTSSSDQSTTSDSTSSSDQSTTSDSTSSSSESVPPSGSDSTGSSDSTTTSVPTEVMATTITQPAPNQVDSPSATDAPTRTQPLARTGNDLAGPMSILGIALVGVGTGLVVVAARRRHVS